MASSSVTTMICDQCGKEEKSEVGFHTPDWIDLSIDKAPEEGSKKTYEWDSYDFCSWGCARDFCDDEHALLEF